MTITATVSIIHAVAESAPTCVAQIEASGESIEQLLESAYRVAHSSDGQWMKRPEVKNSIAGAQRLRDTAVGDVLHCPAGIFRVDMVGFTRFGSVAEAAMPAEPMRMAA